MTQIVLFAVPRMLNVYGQLERGVYVSLKAS
jgi:hypothetical protein